MTVAKSWGYRLHEWRDLTEDDRDLLMAHATLVCSECGNLRSVCSDPTVDWHPDTETCWPTATRQWAWRRLSDKYAKHRLEDGSLGPLDGRTLWVSQQAPEVDKFATEIAEGPTAPNSSRGG